MAALSRSAARTTLPTRKGSSSRDRSGCRSSASTGPTPARLLSSPTSPVGIGVWIQRICPDPPLPRRFARSRPLVLRRDVGVRLDVLAVALVPPVEHLGGDEDRREGARDDADEEGERDVAQ